jgi:hypothetical protein
VRPVFVSCEQPVIVMGNYILKGFIHARLQCHEQVVRVLQKDGWHVTDEQIILTYAGEKLPQ